MRRMLQWVNQSPGRREADFGQLTCPGQAGEPCPTCTLHAAACDSRHGVPKHWGTRAGLDSHHEHPHEHPHTLCFLWPSFFTSSRAMQQVPAQSRVPSSSRQHCSDYCPPRTSSHPQPSAPPVPFSFPNAKHENSNSFKLPLKPHLLTAATVLQAFKLPDSEGLQAGLFT